MTATEEDLDRYVDDHCRSPLPRSLQAEGRFHLGGKQLDHRTIHLAGCRWAREFYFAGTVEGMFAVMMDDVPLMGVPLFGARGCRWCFEEFPILARSYLVEHLETHPVGVADRYMTAVGGWHPMGAPFFGSGEIVARLQLSGTAARSVIRRWGTLRSEWMDAATERRIELWQSVEQAMGALAVAFPVDGEGETLDVRAAIDFESTMAALKSTP